MPGALKAKVAGNWVLASSAAGGGGAEEVYVGPIDPGAAYDLWIDTGTAQTLPQDARWNTAWGQVAVSGGWDAALGAAGNGVYTYVGTITAQLTAGRQYVLSLTQNSSYGSGVGETWGWRPEIDAAPVGGEFYWQIAVAGAYLGPSTQDMPFTVATTGSKSLRVGIRRVNGGGTLQARGAFVIYDTGPVTGALVSPEPTPPWISLPYATGWLHYDANTFYGGAYRRMGDLVYLRGLVTQVGGAAATIGTLPAGYRPARQVIQSQLCSTGQARYDITTSGVITTSTTISAGNWVCFDGVYFSVTA
jgi:hypothetical protein